MRPHDRLARAAVSVAARRWPADLGPLLRDEWLAELAAITGPRSAYRKLTFAGSLMVSPAVDEPSWPERAQTLGRAAAAAAGVTLLAAVSTNIARGSTPALLLAGVAGLAALGRRVRGSVVLLGVALFAFLLAGNPVPVMPFMGAADLAPAVLTWVAGLALVLRLARRRWAVVAGGLATLELATIAGSAHAAAALGVPAWTAPAWFPLSLLPGGTVSFGPHFPDGAAVFGGLSASGPAFHASEILLANAAVMTGPLLLCTAFVLARALGSPSRARPMTEWSRTVVGLAAALAALAVTPLLPVASTDADAVLHRLIDNTTAFGFGFAEHPVGLGAVALLAAVLAMRAVAAPE
ncbi:hypothetical protein [Actinoplanes solisilvae]|uniref:hypothetical protein n=1 Tax=Actinoplanes solisilvae TaxID=2486853 RepID=UPI000FD9DDCB|nr:hypothetical protein [Actinoplanes solisilvae]